MAETKKIEAIGPMIDRLEKIRNRKRLIDAQVKDLDEQYKALQAELIDRLDKEGMDKASGKFATVSRKESVVGQLVDWDLLTKYISRSKNFQLFERRISAAAFREIYDKKGSVPGLAPFTKVSLNHTSLKE